jgi:hypothetical protein
LHLLWTSAFPRRTWKSGFNGEPAVLAPAINMQMTRLGQAARNLMHPPSGGNSLGPSFEYFVGS